MARQYSMTLPSNQVVLKNSIHFPTQNTCQEDRSQEPKQQERHQQVKIVRKHSDSDVHTRTQSQVHQFQHLRLIFSEQ